MEPASALLALQASDVEIVRMTRALDELPEKRAILETRHKAEEVRTLHARAEEMAHRLERQIAANNDDIAAAVEKIAEVQRVLDRGEGINPKEVHNLSREMDALRRRTDKIENETLTLMEKAEKARAQVAKVDAALAQLAAREHALIAAYQEKGGELQRATEAERARRASIGGALDPELLARYESVRGMKGGVGAARLQETHCSACRVELPMERVSELRTGPDIAVCPSCRRLLVVRVADGAE